MLLSAVILLSFLPASSGQTNDVANVFQVENNAAPGCLTSGGTGGSLSFANCEGVPNQHFYFTSEDGVPGQLKTANDCTKCADASTLSMEDCDATKDSQFWTYNPETLLLWSTINGVSHCADAGGGGSLYMKTSVHCVPGGWDAFPLTMAQDLTVPLACGPASIFQVKNSFLSGCLTSGDAGGSLSFANCEGEPNQHFYFTQEAGVPGQLKTVYDCTKCADASTLRMEDCDATKDSQFWTYDPETLLLWSTINGVSRCADAGGAGGLYMKTSVHCVPGGWDAFPLTTVQDKNVCGVAPPTTPMVMGDPHFKTWHGEWYDFHGICDLTLLKNEGFDDGTGMNIHIRTKPRYQYSYVEAAAIKIGDDVLEVGSWGQYWLNGVEGAELPASMASKYTLTNNSQENNKKKHWFQINLNEDVKEAIMVGTFKDMVFVAVGNATLTNFGDSQGLMGRFVNGKRLARDGVTVVEDDMMFGQEWEVLPSEPKLFLSDNQNQPAAGVCAPPASTQGRRRLGETLVAVGAAEEVCSSFEGDRFKMCVMDVVAMADLEVAVVHGDI